MPYRFNIEKKHSFCIRFGKIHPPITACIVPECRNIVQIQSQADTAGDIFTRIDCNIKIKSAFFDHGDWNFNKSTVRYIFVMHDQSIFFNGKFYTVFLSDDAVFFQSICVIKRFFENNFFCTCRPSPERIPAMRRSWRKLRSRRKT